MSGGIDSALALALAVDALGAEHVTAFNMPSKYNTETTRSIAERLAAALGVRYGVIPIQDINDASSRCSRLTPTRSRGASPARTCRRGSAGC